jgi:LL-diaminopimelate aminotransferase
VDLQRASRLATLAPALFAETQRRVREARERGLDVISLGVGDPDEPTPPHIVDALARAATDPAHHHYPAGESRGLVAFREAVATWYSSRFGVDADPTTEVIALLGSKEGNHHLALGVLNPGDVALVPDPAYPVYASSATIAGADVVRLPLRANAGYLVDFDAIPTERLRHAKVLWLCYPNNPTTAVAPLDFFARAVDFAHRHGIAVVNDNPYGQIAFDGVRVHSILEVDGAREVAVEFNSLSKTYNMTGWRVGMAVGNAQLIDAIARVKENTDTGVFGAVQCAAAAALTGPQEVVESNVARYQRRRDVVIHALRSAGIAAEPPQATFYVWAPAPDGMTGDQLAADLLERVGVVVTPGSSYGREGAGFVRLSLATPDERLNEAMHRIMSIRDRVLQ